MRRTLLSVWMGVVLLLAVLLFPGKTVSASEHYAYLSIEKFTLGQGYILEPVKVELIPGEKMNQVLERAMKANGIEWISDQNTTYGYYLRGIKNADSGSSHVPACISAMTIKGQDGVTTAPKDKDVTKDKNERYPNLEEMSYTCDSGWMYFINNTCPNIGFGGYTVEDGDVIRVQFTLFGIGRDVGNGYDEQSLDLPKRAEATKRLALVNENRALCFSFGYEEAYQNAVKAVSDLDSNQKDIDDAIAALPDEGMIAQMAEGLDEETLAKMVSKVEELIDMIGTVTLEKESVIGEAWQAYLSLPAAQKEQVNPEKTTVLQQAKQELQRLKDLQTVEAVSEKIQKIPNEITLDEEKNISEARAAYDQMTDSQRQLFNEEEPSLVEKLETAEKLLQDIKDIEAANTAQEQILAIGEVTRENYLSKLSLLAKAEGTYKQLSDGAKKKVDSDIYQQMVDARAFIDAIYEEKYRETCEEFKAAVEQICEVTVDKESDIKAAKKLYNRLTSNWQELVREEYQELLQKEQELEKLKKTPSSGTDSGTGNVSSEKPASPTKPTATTTEKNTTAAVKVGNKVIIGGIIYKVTASSAKSKTVSLIGLKKKTAAKVTIPATIKINKSSYRVTSISGKAMANCKKLTTVTIGKNVAQIGSKAFSGCSKLKKITVKSSGLKKVGSKAFSGIYKKAVIKVPKKKLKAYQKLLKGKGQKKTVVIK